MYEFVCQLYTDRVLDVTWGNIIVSSYFSRHWITGSLLLVSKFPISWINGSLFQSWGHKIMLGAVLSVNRIISSYLGPSSSAHLWASTLWLGTKIQKHYREMDLGMRRTSDWILGVDQAFITIFGHLLVLGTYFPMLYNLNTVVGGAFF